jgi:hypothetical protein
VATHFLLAAGMLLAVVSPAAAQTQTTCASSSVQVNPADMAYQVTNMTFSFTLSPPAAFWITTQPANAATMSAPSAPVVTSAGVYDANGVLICTIWSAQLADPSGVPYCYTNSVPYNVIPADSSDPAIPGTTCSTRFIEKYTGPFCPLCTIRILSSNIAYYWDGVIGNTSAMNQNGNTMNGVNTSGGNCSSASTFVSPFCWFPSSQNTPPGNEDNYTYSLPSSNLNGYRNVSNGFQFLQAYQWGNFSNSSTGLATAMIYPAATYAFSQNDGTYNSTGWAVYGYAEMGSNLAAFYDAYPNNPMIPTVQVNYPASSNGLGAIDQMANQNISFDGLDVDSSNLYLANAGQFNAESYVTAYALQQLNATNSVTNPTPGLEQPSTWNASTTMDGVRTFSIGSGNSADWFTSDIANGTTPDEFPEGVQNEAVLDYGPDCSGADSYSNTSNPIAPSHMPSPFSYALPVSVAVQFGPRLVSGGVINSGNLLAVGHVAANCGDTAIPYSPTQDYTSSDPLGYSASESNPNIKVYDKASGAKLMEITASHISSSLYNFKVTSLPTAVTGEPGNLTGGLNGTTFTGFNPVQMAFSTSGLWVLNRTLDYHASAFVYDTTEQSKPNQLLFIPLNVVSNTLDVANATLVGYNGESNPVAITVGKSNGASPYRSENADELFVLDGGTNQQLFVFSTTGLPFSPSNCLNSPPLNIRYACLSPESMLYAYGLPGGYAGPRGNSYTVSVAPDRLMLDVYSAYGPYSLSSPAETYNYARNGSKVAVEINGDVWITDGGNRRTLHITPSHGQSCAAALSEKSFCYVNQISNLRPNDSALTLDLSDPSRMFVGMLEYKLDTSKPLIPGDASALGGGNGAWQLVNNWAAGLGPALPIALKQARADRISTSAIVIPSVIEQAWDAPQESPGVPNGSYATLASGMLVYMPPSSSSTFNAPMQYLMLGSDPDRDQVGSYGAIQNNVMNRASSASAACSMPSSSGCTYGELGWFNSTQIPNPPTPPYTTDFYDQKIAYDLSGGITIPNWSVSGAGSPRPPGYDTYSFTITSSNATYTRPSIGLYMYKNVTPSMNDILPVFQPHENAALVDGTQIQEYSPATPHFAGISTKSGAMFSAGYVFQTMPELCLESYAPGQTGYFPYLGETSHSEFVCAEEQDTFAGAAGTPGHDGVGSWTVNLPINLPANSNSPVETPTAPSYGTFVVGYNGQGAAIGDQFYHYNDDGLMIGQFGNTGFYDLQKGAGGTGSAIKSFPVNETLAWLADPPVEGVAENAMRFQVAGGTSLDRTGNAYFYHTDENKWAGIHRWSMWNTNTINEITLSPCPAPNCFDLQTDGNESSSKANFIKWGPLPAAPMSEGTAYTLNATASSKLPVTLSTDSAPICTVIASAAGIITVLAGTDGICTIWAYQDGNTSYPPATPVSQSFAVLLMQTITFPALPASLTEGAYKLTATASSGLPVSYSAGPTSVCTITAGSTVTATGVGRCTVVATQAGNAKYSPATSVSLSFTASAP